MKILVGGIVISREIHFQLRKDICYDYKLVLELFVLVIALSFLLCMCQLFHLATHLGFGYLTALQQTFLWQGCFYLDIVIFFVDGLITFALKHKSYDSSDMLTKFICDSETFFVFFVGKRRNELFDLENKNR